MPGVQKFVGIVNQVDAWVQQFGLDPYGALKSIPFKTVGVVGVGIIIAILIIDLLGYMFAAYAGTSRSYRPYSRTAIDFLVDAWENKHYNYIGEYYDPYAQSRSLGSVTTVLDDLASAWKKWGEDEAQQVDDWQVSSRMPARGGFTFSQ